MIIVHGDEQIRRTVQAVVLGLSLPMFLCPCFSVFTKAILAAMVTYLVTGNRPWRIYILIKTLPRDLSIIRTVSTLGLKIWRWERNNMTIAKTFLQFVEKHPEKVAYHAEDGDWTYKKLNGYAARFAACLPQDVVVRGEPIALALGTKTGPRIIGAWLGLSQRGVPSALLPPSARMAALKHAILASKAKVLVFSDEMAEAISQIQDEPELQTIRMFQYNMDPSKTTPVLKNTQLINPEDSSISSEPLYDEIKKGCTKDPLIYIYTSGTTGLPKAAIITNHRFYMIVGAGFDVLNLNPDSDVFYTPLPLYHTAGGVLGAGQAICSGVTVAQRNKFSATNYWNDCIKYNCTIAQYIGEICRFLLVTQQKSGAPVPDHKIRIMFGNGLRAAIWDQFKTTFKIPNIFEFYGATEGNANMVNTQSQEGAVGFLPTLFPKLAPLMLIKCHQTTGEPMRDDRGFCIRCKPGEPGLLIGEVSQKSKVYAYTGYVDKSANEKKMVRDVKKAGDCFFNTGDVVVMDDFGYIYFKDRTGDTFRWRGENVSTAEVEGILTSIIGLTEIVVFGVEIPHIEGRAGMAALVDPQNKLDLESLIPEMNKSLPPFARPIFIRKLPQMPLTTTFKIIKTDIQKDGYNINVVNDPIYFLDPKTNSYVLLTKSLYEDVISNRIRL